MATKFIRIDEANCPRCGPKGAMVVKGHRYAMPVTMDMAVVERTPWKCECGEKIKLEVEVVE
jgi:hypothetical protein